jgi:hypothetical protein
MGVITARSMGWLRTGVGIVLVVAPGATMRITGTDDPSGPMLLLMRTIGIRDLVLGAGTVLADRSGAAGDSTRWVSATLASDALDTVASLVARRSIGNRDAVGAAALAFAFVCGDLAALRAPSSSGA